MDIEAEERARIRAELRAAPSPARRGGLALTLLALMLFAWPQLTGTQAATIGGVDPTTLGWIALAAGWVLLIAAIVIRTRRFRKLAPPRA